MTGWNLPPGCNVSDIPGNRPEDMAAEAIEEAAWEAMSQHLPVKDEEPWHNVCEEICKLISAAYGDGYQQGIADQAHANELAANPTPPPQRED